MIFLFNRQILFHLALLLLFIFVFANESVQLNFTFLHKKTILQLQLASHYLKYRTLLRKYLLLLIGKPTIHFIQIESSLGQNDIFSSEVVPESKQQFRVERSLTKIDERVA